jgi:hypothetical protein
MLIFPISEKLRYLTPFHPAEEVAEYLKKIHDQGGKSLTIFDDGEKFGLWPETYEWVYEKGWLEDFIDAVTESEHTEFALFKDTVRKQKPTQIAYLPTVSYFEMGEWSLFSERTAKMAELVEEMEEKYTDDTTKVFVKGGIWKNFLVKYPESNRIHKRTLNLSKKAAKLNDAALFDALYKAQCNDVLWHGIFGGLYLPNLRNNAYRFIIEAEKRLEEISETKAVETGDFDFDGYDEAYLRGKSLNCMFVSRDCGQLTAFEDKDNLFNFQNTLARRKEAYHEKLFAEEKPKDTAETTDDTDKIKTIHDSRNTLDDEMKKYLVYDWHNKNSFIDHFVPAFDAEAFEQVKFSEMGDFANQPAEMTVSADSVTFVRQGGIFIDGTANKAEITKTFAINGEALEFEIDIRSAVSADYVLELNLHFNNIPETTVNGVKIDNIKELMSDTFIISDANTPKSVKIIINTPTNLHGYIVKTLSQSESGADLTSQGVCLLMPFKLSGSLKLKGSLSLI